MIFLKIILLFGILLFSMAEGDYDDLNGMNSLRSLPNYLERNMSETLH
ncbi:hypothetical protein X975_09022, partial [Stegodyphus mimosarum]